MLAIIKVIPNMGLLITPNENIDPKKFKLRGFNAEIPTNTFKSPPANNPSSQSIKVSTKVSPIEIRELKIYENSRKKRLIIRLDNKPIPKNKNTR
jgi:hypothetical protein